MKVMQGDVIGTKDGRYGTILTLVSQDSFEVVETVYPMDDCPVGFTTFWASIDDVASIL